MSTISSNLAGRAIRGELASKYEAWATKLEENIAALARLRRAIGWVFAVSLVCSAASFFAGTWIGVGVLATGILVSVSFAYITSMRGSEYARELARTRAQVRSLAASRAPGAGDS